MQTYKVTKTFEDGQKAVVRTGQSQDQIIEFLRELEKQGFKINFEAMSARTLSGRSVFKTTAEQ